MRDRATGRGARAQIIVGLVLGVAGVATLIAGRLAASVFVGVLCLGAYIDLRRLLASDVHMPTFALGALGVGAFLWTGYTGELDVLPAVVAVLTMTLLVTRILLNEARLRSDGVTADLAATVGACGIVGVLGAHVLLVRAVPRFGFRGLLALGAMVIANDVAAFFVGRSKGRRVLNKQLSPHKTWEGALAGFIASVVVGLVVGIALDPPFTITFGLGFGAATGVVAPLGDLAFSVIKRSAGARHSGTYLGDAGGLLDVIDSMLFTAPAFYWAFRTIAL